MTHQPKKDQPKKEEPEYTNEHVIRIDSGVATHDQIKGSIHKAIIDAANKLKRPLDTLNQVYKINVVCRNDKPIGRAYVWFVNPEMAYLLLGKNPNGTDRVELYDDPDWAAPEEPRETIQACSFGDDDDIFKTDNRNWADICEEEERYICPKLTRRLGPLIKLDPVEYGPGQKIHQHQLIIDEHKFRGTWKEGMVVDVPDKLYLPVEPATVKSVDDNVYPDVVCGNDIPAWVNEVDIKKIFVPFTSDPKREVEKKINGKFVKDTYPFVSIVEPTGKGKGKPAGKGRRMAFITFDRNTKDAQFALLMTRKIDFTKSNPSTGGASAKGAPDKLKCVLIFNHAKRNESY